MNSKDTNFAQYQLVKPGRAKSCSGGGRRSINLQVRGASVSNILKLKRRFTQVKEITLVQNYRSAQEAWSLAYHFIKPIIPTGWRSSWALTKKISSPLKPKKGVIEVLEGKDLSEELNESPRKYWN